MLFKTSVRKILLVILFLTTFFTAVTYAQENKLSAKEQSEGWQLLFDGSSMSKWRSSNSDSFPTKGWTVEDGVLSIGDAGGRQSGGDIISRDQFDDFDFMFDFKLTEGANSGVKYSVHIFNPPVRGLGAVLGPEYQVLDDEKHPDAKAGRNGNRKLGSLYDILPSNATSALKPIGQWNTGRIISKGNRVEHWLNGTKVLEYDKTNAAYKEAFALSKFKDVNGYGESAKGHLLLQDHGNKVYFKNIKVRKL